MKCEFLTFSIMIWNDIRPIGLYHFLLKKKIGKGKGEGRGGGGGALCLNLPYQIQSLNMSSFCSNKYRFQTCYRLTSVLS